MKTKFNYDGYYFSVVGIVPTGESFVRMVQEAKWLNEIKGTFKMQVEHKGIGSISTINFKKI
jgi:hypothetical protein